MSKFEESNFYKALQDFFINADKKTFLQFLAEFYNRTEGIIDKNNIQDDLIKELRELYIMLNEKGIDENIVKEKVYYFLNNSEKIRNIVFNLDSVITKLESINVQLNTKADKNEVGTPLIANSVSEMIDNTKVYVNSSDGNWYTWNGNEWVIGGVYNSIAIGNKSITPIKTTFLKQTKNLFNKDNVKKGYYWDVTRGEQVNRDFSYAKVYCENGKKYIATGTNYNVVFFNSQGVKLGADNNSNGLNKCIISTEEYTSELSYFIVSFRHKNYDVNEYMVVEGEELPSEFIEYGFKFDGKILFDKDRNRITVKKDGTGDFTRVFDAIKHAERYAKKDNIINIEIYDTSTNHKGTSFDILEEMGGVSYLESITNTSNNQMGLPLKDYINLIGIGKVKLYAHLPETCTLTQSTCFSTIDIFGECTLENLTIEIKNGRYAVHDESNNKNPYKNHIFKNCKFIHLGNKQGLWSSTHAYAGGTSAGCKYEYVNCVFDSSSSGGYPWDIHNYAPQEGSIISFNGCEMIKKSSQLVSMKFGFNGYSPVTSNSVEYESCYNDVFIKNIIADGKIEVSPEVNTYDCTNNYRIHNFTNLTVDIKPDFIKS